MNKVVKIILEVVLLFASVFLVWLIYDEIRQPVEFNKQKEYRESVAIQRLKDIRDLQDAFKSVYNRYTPDVDSLKMFYETGEVTVKMNIGTRDDSLTRVNSERLEAEFEKAYRKAHKKMTKEDEEIMNNEMQKSLYERYKQDPTYPIAFSVETKIPVKESLFTDRPDFCIDSLKTIPFSGGTPVEMAATTREVSGGVQVPLFEAKMPYRELLKGLDNQLRINLDASRRDMNKYVGLQVGSIDTPNNNAGNWE